MPACLLNVCVLMHIPVSLPLRRVVDAPLRSMAYYRERQGQRQRRGTNRVRALTCKRRRDHEQGHTHATAQARHARTHSPKQKDRTSQRTQETICNSRRHATGQQPTAGRLRFLSFLFCGVQVTQQRQLRCCHESFETVRQEWTATAPSMTRPRG
jgi:hypothetical protein